MKKIGLSIDWDYFVPLAGEYDFGSNDNMSMDIINALWHIRYATCKVNGIDLQKEINTTQKDYSMLLTNIEYKMLIKISNNCKLGIADSHLYAFDFFYGGIVDEIINIDNHHDLVYDNICSLNCGNWLGMLILLQQIKFAHIIYPEFRLKEPDVGINELKKYKWLKNRYELLNNFEKQYPTFNDSVVTHIFICRSGAWTPIWTDVYFNTFVQSIKFDLKLNNRSKNYKIYDDLKNEKMFVREFNMKFVDSYNNMINKIKKGK